MRPSTAPSTGSTARAACVRVRLALLAEKHGADIHEPHEVHDVTPLDGGGHEACPLSSGLLTGTTLTCQCHGSQFDVTTGAVLRGPATDALRTCEAREVDGQIQVRA